MELRELVPMCGTGNFEKLMRENAWRGVGVGGGRDKGEGVGHFLRFRSRLAIVNS